MLTTEDKACAVSLSIVPNNNSSAHTLQKLKKPVFPPPLSSVSTSIPNPYSHSNLKSSNLPPSRIPRWNPSKSKPSSLIVPNSNHASSSFTTFNIIQERPLLLKILRAWKTIAKHQHAQWRMGITADVKRRYDLTLRILQFWKIKLIQSKLLKKAVIFNQQSVYKHTLQIWFKYWEKKKYHFDQIQFAEHWHHHHLILSFWYLWLIRLRNKKKQNWFMSIALKWNTRRLKRHVIQYWLHQVQMQSQWKLQCQSIQTWFFNSLQRRCFYAWVHFLKQSQHWHHLIFKFSQTLHQRQLHSLWCHWVRKCHTLQELTLQSQLHYQSTLLMKYYQCWQSAWKESKRVTDLEQSMHLYYQQRCQRRCFQILRQRMASNNEADVAYLKLYWYRLRRMYFKSIWQRPWIRSLFMHWYSCTLQKMYTRKLSLASHVFRQHQLQQKTFHAWQLYIEEWKQKQALLKFATCSYWFALKKKTMFLWIQVSDEHLFYQQLLLPYLNQRQVRLKQRAWLHWKEYIEFRQLKSKSLHRATHYALTNLIQSTLRKWIQSTCQRKYLRCELWVANEFYAYLNLKHAFHYWKSITQWRLYVSQLQIQALHHYQLLYKRKCFFYFKAKFQWHQTQKQKLYKAIQWNIHRLIYQCWQIWRYQWKLSHMADMQFQCFLLKKVIRWLQYRHALAREEKSKLLESIEHFKKKLNERIFCAWILYTKLQTLKKIHLAKAEHLYQIKSLNVFFSIWKKRHHLVILNKTRCSCAAQFFKTHLLRSTFLIWYHQRTNWRQLYQMNFSRPLEYHRTIRLRRFLLGWRHYVQRQKEAHWRIQFAEKWGGFASTSLPSSSSFSSLSLKKKLTNEEFTPTRTLMVNESPMSLPKNSFHSTFIPTSTSQAQVLHKKEEETETGFPKKFKRLMPRPLPTLPI